MLRWMWILAISILMDIEGIAFIKIGNLGLLERIAMAFLILVQVIFFFVIAYVYVKNGYKKMGEDE